MSHPHVTVTVDGPVCTVTLSNPEQRNAQTPSLWRELIRIANEMPSDVRVVVLRAQGPDFSAGLHRNMFTPQGVPGEPSFVDIARPGGEELIAEFQQAFTVWRSIPPIVVVSVHGNAIGAGCQLAIAGDVMVVADDARLSMKEVSLGLVPDLGGTHLLVSAIGRARALEMCATGRVVSGREAADWGLANRAVPAAELAQATEGLVAELLAAPVESLRAIKPLIEAAVTNTASEQLAAERTTQVGLIRQLNRPH